MNEQDIISRIQANDDEALRYLYVEMRSPIIARLLKYGATKEDAMDVFQDALVAFYRNVQNNKFTGEHSKISTYLYAISRNLWLKKVRQQSRNLLEVSALTSQSPESIFIENENSDEMKESLELALSKMSDKCRNLISEYYLESKSNEEIAKELGFASASTSKVMKYRCLRQLREIFRQQLEERKENG